MRDNIMKLEITKEVFCGVIEAVKRQTIIDKDFSSKMASIFPDSNMIMYDNEALISTLICLLEDATNPPKFKDGTSLVSYFIYDLDFGVSHTEGCFQVDSKNIDISTPEKLYTYISTK